MVTALALKAMLLCTPTECRVAYEESRFVADTVNKYGFVGMFQIAPQTVKQFGIVLKYKSKNKIDLASFPIDKQIAIFRAIQKQNAHYLRNWVKYNKGRYSFEALLYASLSGYKNVGLFLKYGIDKKDGHGQRISFRLNSYSYERERRKK